MALTKLTSVDKSVAKKLLDTLNKDLSTSYVFDTVADFKASTIVFPDGKRLYLKDTGDYYEILGLSGDIGNTITNQSLFLSPLGGITSTPKFLKWLSRSSVQNPLYIIGDSITEGSNADDFTTKSYAAIIRTSIQQHFGNRNHGFFNFNIASPSVKYVSNQQTTGAITTIFIDNVFGGILSVGSFDSSASGTTTDITGSNFSDMGQFTNFFSAGYYGKHTIKFTATSGGAVRLLGMTASDGAYKIPSVFNVGRSSLRATQMPDDILQAYAGSGCTILALGVNDNLAGASIVDYEAKIRVVLDRVIAINGECIILDFIFSEPTSNAYKTVMRDLSNEYGYQLFDFSELWFGNEASNKSSGLLDADGVHPTNLGHTFIARTVLESIGVPTVIDSDYFNIFTGVLTPLLNSNWQEGQIPGYGGAYASLNRDQVVITGFLSNTSGGTLTGPSTILNLPKLLGIDSRMVFSVASASGNINVEVDGVNNVLKVMSGSSVPDGDWISLSGISYSTSLATDG